MQAVIDLLRPKCELRWEPEVRARLARLRLDQICAEEVHALEGLDMNRRVCVTGAAGTGKTRLAHAWVRRALLAVTCPPTCFNIPLAETIDRAAWRATSSESAPSIRSLSASTGCRGLDVPQDADKQWWDRTAIGYLQNHWHEVTERFDTIVTDEAQDFNPTWITMLTELLDPAGPRRVFMLADETQRVYDAASRCRASTTGGPAANSPNCRNTLDIASLLRRRFFNGAIAPVGGPESEAVTWIEVTELDAMVEAVGDVLDNLEDRDHAAPSVLVATFTGSVRDRLREEYAFVRFEVSRPDGDRV